MPTTAQDDMRIWREYKRYKDQRNTRMANQKAKELYKQMKGLIHDRTNRFRGRGIPMVAVESKGREQFKKALDTYDPKFGTKLSTHVTNYLKQVNNYVRDYKDFARIPQNRTLEIDNYSKTKAELEVELGREPSAQEMAEELKWDINNVNRMENELKRKELSSTGLEESLFSQNFDKDSRTKETIDLVYSELGGREQAVMEYLLGMNGKPKLKGKEIAKALNTSPATISRVRRKIADKIEEYR